MLHKSNVLTKTLYNGAASSNMNVSQIESSVNESQNGDGTNRELLANEDNAVEPYAGGSDDVPAEIQDKKQKECEKDVNKLKKRI